MATRIDQESRQDKSVRTRATTRVPGDELTRLLARGAVESKYARFFAIANVAFWTADATGRIGFASRRIAGSSGTAPTIVDAAAQAAMIHPGDRRRAVRGWRTALATGEAYDIEVRAREHGGADYRWVRLQAYPDRDLHGRVVGWYGTSEDIDERCRVALALAESEARFKQLADDMPVMVWLTDADNRTTYLSLRWYEFTGQTEATGLQLGWIAAIVPADLPRLAPISGLVAARKVFELDFRLRRADGEERWVMSSGRPRFGSDGGFLGYAGVLTDIHARKIAERDVAAMQMRLSRALDGTGVGVWEWDGATDSVVINGGALGISGIRNVDVDYQAIDYRAAIHIDDHPRLFAAMEAYVAGSSAEFEVEIRVRTRDRGWVWVLDRGTATARDARGRALHMVGTLTDIEDSKRAEAKLRWTVEHDALTGLANRTLLQARLETALAAGRDCALVLLDIDDFKTVNDLHGHGAGDALLGVLADRLRAFAEPGETAARLGGDEFTLLIENCGAPAAVMARLDGLRAALDTPFRHDGQCLTCRSSIGVAFAPEHGNETSLILKSADVAMYSAKHGGRGGIACFEPALGARLGRDAARLTALREVLDAGRIAPCYEAVVSLADGTVPGYEAYARIAGDAGDIVDGHEAVVIGDADLAVRLGDLLIDRVLADFVGWRAAGVAPIFIAVNVALTELQRDDYAPRLLARLAAHGIPPDCLRIEILEAGLNGGRGTNRSEATLGALTRSGIKVGLDRFGAGSASLSHLTRLTLAAIKIDPQFVQRVAETGSEQTVVRAVIGLAHSFGLRSVALGVETAAQAAKLLELGCTYSQGPLNGLPLDSAAMLAALRGGSGRQSTFGLPVTG